jgi:hypothetical protein
MELKLITNKNFINYLSKTILYYWNFKGRDPQFPGAQPVSIERKDFEKLKKYPYYVGVKNDGVRYIMFLTTDKLNNKVCILCDRALNFYIVDGIIADDSIYQNTLLDGELINNNFVVFDSVVLCGNRINLNYFTSRLTEIDCCIRTLIDPSSSINILTKTFYKLEDFETFLENIYEKEENKDGLIFIPDKLGVHSGTQYSLFKWKPSNKHTIDFNIKIVDNNLEAHIYNQKQLIKFANVLYDTPQGKSFIDKAKLLPNFSDNCILECLFNKDEQNFSPILVRTDKEHANSLRTVERTLFNASENILIEEFKI